MARGTSVVRLHVRPSLIGTSQAILYGFLLALSLASFYVNVTPRKHQDLHSKVRTLEPPFYVEVGLTTCPQIMFGAGVLMFFLATFHLGVYHRPRHPYRCLE